MNIIDILKEKSISYFEDVGKKKEELVEKVSLIKMEYDENQRKKMEDWVYKKEAELKHLEKILKKREEQIKLQELKLKSLFFIRFIGVTTGLSIFGIFALLTSYSTTEKMDYSVADHSGNTEANLPSPNPSESYTHRESSVYGTYNGINTSNPNFDIGNYCLDVEKRGGITFEECLGVAAAKLKSKH